MLDTLQKYLTNRSVVFVFFTIWYLLFGLVIVSMFIEEKFLFAKDHLLLLHILLVYVNILLIIYILMTYDKKVFNHMTQTILPRMIIFLLISYSIYFKWLDVYDLIAIETLLFSIIFLLDERFSFLIAINLLVYIPFFLILKEESIAEKLSIYSFYYLVIGIAISLYHTVNGELNIEKKPKLIVNK